MSAPAVAAGLAGAGVTLGVWLVLALWRQARPGATPRPAAILPWWWRALAPLSGVIGWYARPYWRWSARRQAERRLREAGLHPTLAPEQALATGWACALAAAVWGALAASSLEARGPALAGTALVAGLLAARLPVAWLRERARARRAEVTRDLPFVLDLATLCVEGGLNLQAALQQAAEKGPPGALRDELRHLLGEVRAGASRAEAFRQLAQRVDTPEVRAWVAALIQAEALGTSLGPLLRAQADQRRSERFLRAEKRALQAPVKMLFPLIACIFPCTFIVIAYPIGVKLLGVFG